MVLIYLNQWRRPQALLSLIMTSNEITAVPNAITKYQAAHDSRDVATALAQFTFDACVIDDGKTYEGVDGVETFLRKAGSEYTYTRTVISAEEKASDCWRVVNRLEGNFPGGQVDLSYEFQLNDGLIIRLVIAP
jgi:hypothetical protein